VPYVDRGEAKIWYTEQGTGFPMLTLAPGGMRSSVPLWEMAAINPLTAYAGQYRMIAMDQRNAGQSTGPLETGDPWGAYAADQLAVMDHLGIIFRAGQVQPGYGLVIAMGVRASVSAARGKRAPAL
jgi:pimeloyl-ACP methyl ester carboxylesterase